MAVWRLLTGIAGTAAVLVVVVAAYYLFSLLVLNLIGRFLPMAGRGRRRD
ncbi:MAG: hypothetical protein ABIQ52_06475 [Vicinamibacterales bacterium]